jgi:hypothetical protein
MLGRSGCLSRGIVDGEFLNRWDIQNELQFCSGTDTVETCKLMRPWSGCCACSCGSWAFGFVQT